MGDKEWLLFICKDNEDAANFLEQFFFVCHLWDDLIDKDQDRADEHINNAFWMAFIEIPRNPYYRHNFNDIQPIMANAIQEWFVANLLEESHRTDISYTLRCSIVSLIHQAAYLCGGYEWALSVGEEIRLKTQSETIDEYLEKFPCQI